MAGEGSSQGSAGGVRPDPVGSGSGSPLVEIAALGVTRAEVVGLEPGDVLVMYSDRLLDETVSRRLAAMVRSVFGGRVPVLILDQGLGLQAFRATAPAAGGSGPGGNGRGLASG